MEARGIEFKVQCPGFRPRSPCGAFVNGRCWIRGHQLASQVTWKVFSWAVLGHVHSR